MITQAQTHRPDTVRSDLRAVGTALHEVLVDLVDLSLLGKHAHWNLEGVNFRALHLELDELVDEWRRLSDDVAERAVTLGFAPDAQIDTLARLSRIDPFTPGRVRDHDVIDGLTDRLAPVIDRARGAMGFAAVRDTVSEHVLLEVVKTLEKQHWMLRVQRDRSGPGRP